MNDERQTQDWQIGETVLHVVVLRGACSMVIRLENRVAVMLKHGLTPEQQAETLATLRRQLEEKAI